MKIYNFNSIYIIQVLFLIKSNIFLHLYAKDYMFIQVQGFNQGP